MTESTPPTEAEDQAARNVCREILKADPEATYRDVRREARDRGAKVTRRVFSAVLQELYPDRKQAREEFEPRGPGGFRHEGGPDRPDDGGPRPPHRRPLEDQRRPAPRPAFDNPHIAPRRRPEDARGPESRPDHGRPADAARGKWDDLWKSPAPPQQKEAPTPDIADLFGGGRSEAPPSRPPEGAPIRASAVEFMAAHLRDNPEAPYKEVRELAEDNGYTVSAAAFGRAQVIAGILERDEDEKPQAVVVPAAPAPAAKPPAEAKRKVAASARKKNEVFEEGDPLFHLQEFIKHFGEAAKKRGELRAALEEMLQVVQQALKNEP